MELACTSHKNIFVNMARSMNWCFTLNNYDDSEVEAVKALKCRYLVFGFEVGKNETPHLQGLICFKSQVSFKSIKKKIPRAHVEPKRGTFEEASNYCKKDGNFFESGELPLDPKRKGKKGGDAEIDRWGQARKLAEEGKFD